MSNVTRRTAAVASGLVLAAGTLMSVPAQAHEVDQRPCVSISEFRSAKLGMSMHRVHAIFDTDGRQFGSRTQQRMERWYRICFNDVDRATAVFGKRGDTWRLRSKNLYIH